MDKRILMKSSAIAVVVMAFAAVIIFVIMSGAKDSASSGSSSKASSFATEYSSAKTAAQQSIVSSGKNVSDKPAYFDGVLIVNKTYSLPKDYGNGITADTQAAFDAMKAAAKKDGISLWIVSGYRSYSRQETLYNGYAAAGTKAEADRFSARPGYSEHQTGLALDLNNASGSFEGTKEADWLADNCYKYGFIIRYGKDKEQYTGFKYEPWHVRFVGTQLALRIYKSGLCLEEYFGINSVYAD